MYRINLDVVKGFVYIELAGSLQLNELLSYINDLENLMSKFPSKELSILILGQRLDPLSQDKKMIFQKAIDIILNNSRKIAIVHGNRFITRYQIERIEQEVRSIHASDTKIARFTNTKDALDYLQNDTNL